MNDIDGIIILDKPSNYDSHQITAHIQKLLGAEKIGHSGTLDPKVTGVLIIFLGKTARLSEYFSKLDKEYAGIMHLHKDCSEEKLKKAAKKFVGNIKQIPPRKSAVKRQERERKIYEFKIIEKQGKDILFSVKCESGTYIRKLVHDFGNKLETGAHMLELRRVKEGPFSEGECINVYDINKTIESNKINDIIKPIEIITRFMPFLTIKNEFLQKAYNGSPIFDKFVIEKDFKEIRKGEFIAVLTSQKKLVGVVQAVLDGDKIAVPRTIIR